MAAFLGFAVSFGLAWIFRTLPRRDLGEAISKDQLECMANQILELRKLRDAALLRWPAAILALHIAVLTFYGWLLEHSLPARGFPVAHLVAISNTSLWAACWLASAALAESNRQLRRAVAFVGRGDDTPLGRFVQAVHGQTLVSGLQLVLLVGLFFLGFAWGTAALGKWSEILY
ncbi:MAG: hypothetical protein V4510_00700 [bacterium]